MVKKILIAMWVLLVAGILAVVLAFYAIASGWIGYMPSIEELENLVANIGYDELAKRIGNTGVSNLMKALNTDSIADVKKHLKKQDGQVGLFADEDIDLFSKVEFNQLSKGEKQELRNKMGFSDEQNIILCVGELFANKNQQMIISLLVTL